MTLKRLLIIASAVVVLIAQETSAQQRPPLSELPTILVGSWRLDLTDRSKKDLENPNVRRNLGITDEMIDAVRSQTFEFAANGSYRILDEDSAEVDSGSYTIDKLRLLLSSPTAGQRELDLGIESPRELIMQPRSENAPLPGFWKWSTSQSVIWKASKQSKAVASEDVPPEESGGITPFFVFGVEKQQESDVPCLAGFFRIHGRDDAFYLYGIDATTGKLVDVHAIYGTRIDTSREYTSKDEVFEQAEYNATATRNNPSGRSFVMASLSERISNGKYEHAMIELFDKVLPKYHEWAGKAEEVKPQPFKKEIPLDHKYGRYWANFIWTAEAKPQLELFEQYRGKDGNGTVMGGENLLKDDQVEELAEALKMREQAVSVLNKLLKEAVSNSHKEKQKIEDNFN